MSWVDYAIMGICVASAAFSFSRGFVKEALALVTWLLAIVLAWQMAWVVEGRLGEWTAAPELRVWAARAIVFVVVVVVGGLLSWLLRSAIRKSALSGTDRSLGTLFGFARGALLVGLLAIAVDKGGLAEEDWWSDARLGPYSEQLAEGILYYAELGGRYFDLGQDSLDDIL